MRQSLRTDYTIIATTSAFRALKSSASCDIDLKKPVETPVFAVLHLDKAPSRALI